MNGDSYHILIYGINIENDNLKCISPFKEYYAPMRNTKGPRFIGIKFDRIDRLFQDYTHDSNILTISNAEPSQKIKDLWLETYPEIEAKCYCIIQNVYVSHYANGSVVYGYWLHTEDDETSDLLNDFRGEDIGGMNIFCTEHTQTGQVPSDYFFGKLLASLPDNEDGDDCQLLAENVMKIYNPVNISSKLDCINLIVNELKIDPKNITVISNAEITVICNMCYCCT